MYEHVKCFERRVKDVSAYVNDNYCKHELLFNMKKTAF